MKRCFSSLAAALVLFCLPPARAATNIVTTLADSGPGSLRAALADALPGDAITFATNGTLTLTSGELVITKDLSIYGPGRTNLDISGNSSSRVLRINGYCNAFLSGLTVRNGRTPDGTNGVYNAQQPFNFGGPSAPGGAIFNLGILVMVDCALNSSGTGHGGNGGAFFMGRGGDAGHGGAIYNPGAMRLTNCSFSGNRAGNGGQAGFGGNTYGRGGDAGHGGAIYGGNIVLHGCTFTGNGAGIGGFGGANTGYYQDGGGIAGSGGAIYTGGVLVMNDCTLSSNTSGAGGGSGDGGSAAEGGQGGAVYVIGSGKVIQHCRFLGNTTGDGGRGGFYALPSNGGKGGAIYNGGSLVLNNCTVSGNGSGFGGRASQINYSGGNGGDGGGIYNANTLSMTNSTVSGNATGLGGDANYLPQGLIGNGGGICSIGPLTLNSCTISSNRLGREIFYVYVGSPSLGGGIYSTTNSPPQLVNTLVAGNYCGYLSNYYYNVKLDDDLFGPFSSQGHNLISATNRSTGFIAPNDLVGSLAAPLDARLGPLANNGGPSFTHALLPGSPALDAGDNTLAAALATDQRGSPRFSGPHVDIGAFEWLQPQLTEPGRSNGFFGFVLNGAVGSNYVIQVSSNLVTWQPFLTNTVPGDGRVPFSDPSLTNLPMRFYRAVPE